MTDAIDKMIADVVAREGGYVNDPADPGGETNYGVTVAVARANGYTGAMKDMTPAQAAAIYRAAYVVKPGFDQVAAISVAVASELVDTGINMGASVASTFLQRALNVLNEGGKLYADLTTDGKLGPATLVALQAYLKVRRPDILLRALNCLQGSRYIEIAEARPASERFVYGWLLNRVGV